MPFKITSSRLSVAQTERCWPPRYAHTAFSSGSSVSIESLRKLPMPSSVANRRLQSLSRNRAAPRTLVADEPGQGWFRGSALLPFTHEFLASMLGTGRASVSIAAGILQKADFIQYRRGAVRVLNRKNFRTCHL